MWRWWRLLRDTVRFIFQSRSLVFSDQRCKVVVIQSCFRCSCQQMGSVSGSSRTWLLLKGLACSFAVALLPAPGSRSWSHWLASGVPVPFLRGPEKGVRGKPEPGQQGRAPSAGCCGQAPVGAVLLPAARRALHAARAPRRLRGPSSPGSAWGAGQSVPSCRGAMAPSAAMAHGHPGERPAWHTCRGHTGRDCFVSRAALMYKAQA